MLGLFVQNLADYDGGIAMTAQVIFVVGLVVTFAGVFIKEQK